MTPIPGTVATAYRANHIWLGSHFRLPLMASAQSRMLWNACEAYCFDDEVAVNDLVAAAKSMASQLSVAQELRRARAASTIKTSLMSFVEAAGTEARLPAGEYEKWLYTVLLRESLHGASHSTKTARRRARNVTKRGTAVEQAEAVRAAAIQVRTDPLLPVSARPNTDGGALQQAIVALGIAPKRAGAIVSDVCNVATKLAMELASIREREVASAAAAMDSTAANGLRIEWEGTPAPGSTGVPTLVGVVAAASNDAAVTAAKAFSSAASARAAAMIALGTLTASFQSLLPSAAASSASSAQAAEPAGEEWLDKPLASTAVASSPLFPCALVPAAAKSMALCHKKTRMRLTLHHYHKLGELYARGPGRLEPAMFHERLFLVLLRYHGTQGGGFQAAAHAEVFATLHETAGANLECFASPLNCRYAPFCTAFPDTDIWFGGLCSFFDAPIASGAVEANPPFVPAVLDEMQSHLETLLAGAASQGRPLTVAVIIPAWEAGSGWAGLAASPHLARRFTLAQRDHGYLEGSQHWRRTSHRISTCDTSVFVLQTPAAAATKPFTDAAEAALRTAFKSRHVTLKAKRTVKATIALEAAVAGQTSRGPESTGGRKRSRHRETTGAGPKTFRKGQAE